MKLGILTKILKDHVISLFEGPMPPNSFIVLAFLHIIAELGEIVLCLSLISLISFHPSFVIILLKHRPVSPIGTLPTTHESQTKLRSYA